MTQKLNILYFYPELLNLYGDRGNIEILKYRAEKRGINVSIREVKLGTVVGKEEFDEANFIFMGGGSDLNQKILYEDLLLNKKGFLSDYIESSKVGLFICGAYQLLGNYYQTYEGEKIPGLGIIDFFTQNLGPKYRSVGNIKVEINKGLHSEFKDKNSKILYGFENHGGHTFFNKKYEPLGKVKKGYGNNRKEKLEGIIYKNTFGTYLHGPILSLNPEFCDYLIMKSLKLNSLSQLDDGLIQKARERLYLL